MFTDAINKCKNGYNITDWYSNAVTAHIDTKHEYSLI